MMVSYIWEMIVTDDANVFFSFEFRIWLLSSIYLI